MSLAKNKLNIIETLLSSALNDFEISFRYEGIKENIKNIRSEDLNEKNEQKTTL